MTYQEDGGASSPGDRHAGPWHVGQDVVAVRWIAGTAGTVEAGRGKVESVDWRSGCFALGVTWDSAGRPRRPTPLGSELLDAGRWDETMRDVVAWGDSGPGHAPAAPASRANPANYAAKRKPLYADSVEHIVYIVRAADGRHFKIGVTSRGLRKRLAQLQTGNHQALSVVGVLAVPDRRSAKSLERKLHATYAGARGSGEWFELTPAALAEIRALPCVASWCDQ